MWISHQMHFKNGIRKENELLITLDSKCCSYFGPRTTYTIWKNDSLLEWEHSKQWYWSLWCRHDPICSIGYKGCFLTFPSIVSFLIHVCMHRIPQGTIFTCWAGHRLKYLLLSGYVHDALKNMIGKFLVVLDSHLSLSCSCSEVSPWPSSFLSYSTVSCLIQYFSLNLPHHWWLSCDNT